VAKSSTSFKKGHKGGPGQPPQPEEIRKAAKMSKTLFQGIFHRFSLMTYPEFEKHMNKKDILLMEKIVGTIMQKSLGGDTKAAALIWDRMMGKVKENIEIQLPKPMVINRRNGEQVVLGHEEDKDAIDVSAEDK